MPEIDPVGGLVTGAGKKRQIDKGLKPVRGDDYRAPASPARSVLRTWPADARREILPSPRAAAEIWCYRQADGGCGPGLHGPADELIAPAQPKGRRAKREAGDRPLSTKAIYLRCSPTG